MGLSVRPIVFAIGGVLFPENLLIWTNRITFFLTINMYQNLYQMKSTYNNYVISASLSAPPILPISNQTVIDFQSFSDLAGYSLDQKSRYFG